METDVDLIRGQALRAMRLPKELVHLLEHAPRGLRWRVGRADVRQHLPDATLVGRAERRLEGRLVEAELPVSGGGVEAEQHDHGDAHANVPAVVTVHQHAQALAQPLAAGLQSRWEHG